MSKVKTVQLISIALALLVSGPALAAGEGHGLTKHNCPVGDYNGVPMDTEFGYGTQAETQCLMTRHKAKVVVAMDNTHPVDRMYNARTDQATFLSNIEFMIENYEVVHGMEIGKDVDVVVVGSTSGALLLTTHHPVWGVDPVNGPNPNPFLHLVERGLEKGMKFYICQTASRALGINMANKIPGVGFVPGGHIALADFQMQGYALIKP